MFWELHSFLLLQPHQAVGPHAACPLHTGVGGLTSSMAVAWLPVLSGGRDSQVHLGIIPCDLRSVPVWAQDKLVISFSGPAFSRASLLELGACLLLVSSSNVRCVFSSWRTGRLCSP